MAPWLSPAAPKRVSGELRLSDGAETASSVAGAYCLITPDVLLTRWYPANFLRWGNRIFTPGGCDVLQIRAGTGGRRRQSSRGGPARPRQGALRRVDTAVRWRPDQPGSCM